MENLLLACNVVLPLFLMMALGYFLARVKLVDGRTLHVMNELIFKVFLAILLFYNIYTTDLQSAFDFHLLQYAALAVIGCFAAGFLLIPLIEKDNRKRGVLIQGICRFCAQPILPFFLFLSVGCKRFRQLICFFFIFFHQSRHLL